MFHLELPNNENVSFRNGYATLFLAVLTFKHLKSVTAVSSFVTFLQINIDGLKYTEKPFL